MGLQGAPFTLASYMIEGGLQKYFTKAMMCRDEEHYVVRFNEPSRRHFY